MPAPRVLRRLSKALALLGTGLLALLPLVALGDVRSEDYCFASAREDGAYATSKSETIVYGDRTADYTGTVTDNRADGQPALAKFTLIVDGSEIKTEQWEVPDGKSWTVTFYASYVGSYAEGDTTGYYGVKDSRAIARAYWWEFCPV